MNTPDAPTTDRARMGAMLDELGVRGPGIEDRRRAARLAARQERAAGRRGGLVDLLLELLSALPR